jgi:hypothetical protein
LRAEVEMQNLEAGPELDLAVIQQVLGWERTHGWNIPEWGCREGWHDPKRHPKEGGPLVGPDFSPSTDIAAAWRVVEKIHSRALTVEIEAHHDGETAVKVMGYLDGDLHGWVEFPPVWAKTASEAICRAALAAFAR